MKITRRKFFQAALVSPSVSAFPLSFLFSDAFLFGQTSNESRLSFSTSNAVLWRGMFGQAYQKSLQRLSQEPLDTVDFILADVNFNQERRFTNYSGDISGRFIEVASLTSSPDHPQPETLSEVIDQIVAYQKPDGHYGAPVDWNKPVDIANATDQSLEMPILWGNGRLLLGLLAAYERFGNLKVLESAKKLGDFYINIVIPRFCDPARMEEYSHEAAGYAAAYVTCVFHGIEGLIRCKRLTGETKYLEAARTMADFHEKFDILPVGHSHGSLSAHEALLMLYEETGEEKYLLRVVQRWEQAVAEGYVNPCGGVAEQYRISYDTDEGCSEADLLRLNLMLWRNTGQTRYLDFAERLLYNAYLANQWPSGGFGHRHLGVDDQGAFAWLERVAESFWCCSFHGPLGYYELKEFFAVGSEQDQPKILYHFPLDFQTPISFGQETWMVDSVLLPPKANVPVRTRVTLTSDVAESVVEFSIRLPDWADRVRVRQTGTDSTKATELTGTTANGYWTASAPLASGALLEIDYEGVPFLEDRRFHRREIPSSLPAEMGESVLRYGPNIYVTRTDDARQIGDLTLQTTQNAVVLPENVSCLEQMSDAERAEEHRFVFRVTLQP